MFGIVEGTKNIIIMNKDGSLGVLVCCWWSANYKIGRSKLIMWFIIRMNVEIEKYNDDW